MSDVVDNGAIRAIRRRVDEIGEVTGRIESKVNGLGDAMNDMNNELVELKVQFQKMMQQQKKEAALQRATTELVRVRQEIETEFGNYKVVRDTMLGVLQATDAALVKQTTISRVSEELMLSTPKYWLAPCLVAVAAWIGNDRDLADRAIKEAIKRDEEKTAITMALICRRNKRTETCYEWLAIYFEDQDPKSFNEGDFAYIDAYVNGVFGPDEKHVCDGYVQKWMDEIRSSDASYEEKQTQMWRNYCVQFTDKCDGIYPDLKIVSVDFPRIENYISRINAVDPIQDNFKKINDAYVDQESLKKDIDRNLIALISKYDEDEMALRNDEKYFMAVKKNAGDEDAARRSFEQSVSENRNKVKNLIEQMYEVVNKSEGVSTSQKKTAISFIGREINKGFSKFVKEEKESFPDKISLEMYGFKAETSDGSNREIIIRDFIQYNEARKKDEIARTKATSKPLIYMITAGLLGVFGIVMLFVAAAVGVISLVVAAVMLVMSFKEKSSIGTRVANLESQYKMQTDEGATHLYNAVNQWILAKKRAEEFDDSDLRAV